MLDLTHNQLVILAKLVLAAPLMALLLALFSRVRRQTARPHVAWLGWATRLLSGFSLACSILVAMGPSNQFPLKFELVVSFYLDALSVYFVLLVNLVAFFASWYTVNFLQHDQLYGEHHAPVTFHTFFNTFHLTMLLVPMVDNLVILWMAIELTTLASTLLVRYRRQRRALEATWKYISITTAGIVFALFGTILLTDAIKTETCFLIARALEQGGTTCAELAGTDLLHWSLLAQKHIAQTLDPQLVTISFLFIFVGYGTKAGLAPMHTWLPDGHGEAPSPVSALLSGVLLKSALYAILRFYTITNLNQGDSIFTSAVLLFFGLLSLALATPFILKRNKFKRVLAYHSLEHMGIIVFGIGIGGPVALFGALLHALNHALTKALMFLTFSHVRREHARWQNSAEPDAEQLQGVLKSMPLSGIILLLGGLGLVGSPPFNVFFSEFIILWGALDHVVPPHSEGAQFAAWVYVLAVGLFLLTLTLIFGGLVGHLARLLLDRPPAAPPQFRERWVPLAPLLALLGIVTLFGVWIPTTPVDFPRLLEQSVHILQQGAGGP